ncbi:hypothetical protein BCV72DRAFT_206973 [Rhizopus microsporus var. microsporus]|uniref:Tc1-like transposase DDE domain-containing protein n=1 Tax=Rhizopus microsporus var. microsporus TaxID=86635 RepID=A0A1X0R3R8_RHIZD|nr:hypothetical protein BCV72DRAFT_206973 [Rhizopus microsporus var. microsporus]
MFPQIGSINLSRLHKHLVLHASLGFKKLELVVAARTAQSTLQSRRQRALEWQNDGSMDWNQNCVFIDEAGSNMHIRRYLADPRRICLSNLLFLQTEESR